MGAITAELLDQAGMSVGPVDAQAAADFLLQTGVLPKAFDTASVIDTSFSAAFH